MHFKTILVELCYGNMFGRPLDNRSGGLLDSDLLNTLPEALCVACASSMSILGLDFHTCET